MKIKFILLLLVILFVHYPFSLLGQEQMLQKGSYDVNSRGEFRYTINMSVPHGSILTPSIGISYVSNKSTGVVGKGFQLIGFSKISLRTKSLRIDGETGGIGTRDLSALDWDGVPLRSKGDIKSDIVEYIGVGVQTNSQIRLHKGVNTLPYIHIIDKQGREMIYGGNGYIERTSGVIYDWLLKEVIHLGDTMRYIYQMDYNKEPVLKEISYGRSKVTLDYIHIVTELPQIEGGIFKQNNKLLKSINIKERDSIIDKYELNYKELALESPKLVEIRRHRNGVQYKPINICWSKDEVIQKPSQSAKRLYNNNEKMRRSLKMQKTGDEIYFIETNQRYLSFDGRSLISRNKSVLANFSIGSMLYAVDIDGDGTEEILGMGVNSIGVMSNTLQVKRLSITGRYANYVSLSSGESYDNNTYVFGDLNGDGLTDMLRVCKDYGIICFNKGGYFSADIKSSDIYSNYLPGPIHYYSIADVNGNGKSEIIRSDMQYDAYKKEYRWRMGVVYTSDGSKYQIGGEYWDYGTDFIKDMGWSWKDINGDGYADYFKIDDRLLTIEFNLGNKELRSLREPFSNDLFGRGSNVMIGDVNSDGREDFYIISDEGMEIVGGEKRKKIEIVKQDIGYSEIINKNAISYKLSVEGGWIYDNSVEGMGCRDGIIKEFLDSPYGRFFIFYNVDGNCDMQLHVTPIEKTYSEGLIKSIDEGYRKIELDYSKGNNKVRDLNNIYPYQSCQTVVVKSVKESILGGFCQHYVYSYDGGLRDKYNKDNFIGYRIVKKEDKGRNSFEQKNYKLSYNEREFIIDSVQSGINGSVEGIKRYGYIIKTNIQGEVGEYVSKVENYDKLRDIKMESIYKYDKVGNITEEYNTLGKQKGVTMMSGQRLPVNPIGPGYESNTYYTYEWENHIIRKYGSYGNWGISNKIIEEIIEEGYGKKSTVTDTVQYSYNSLGQLTEKRNRGEVVRNSYDLKNKLKSEWYGIGRDIWNIKEYEYDEGNRYVIREKDKSGEISREYDPYRGYLLKEIGLRGNIIKYEYDPYGRMVKQSEGPIIKNTSYNYRESSSEEKGHYKGSVVVLEKAFESGGRILTYYNGKGQVVGKEEYRKDGIACLNKEYDSLGRLERESEAYKKGEEIRWTDYSYDGQDRLIWERNADGETWICSYSYERGKEVVKKGRVSLSYAGLDRQSITGSIGSASTVGGLDRYYKYNTVGDLLEYGDANGVTKFSYIAKGLIDSVNYQGVVQSYLYDVYGRKIGLKNIDGSERRYSYGMRDLLKEEVDEQGLITTYEYDVLDRLVKKKKGDTEIIYSYINESGGSKGKIRFIREGDKLVYNEYNGNGQLISKTEGINDINGWQRSYTTMYGYDKYGREKVHTYPNGYRTFTEYNTDGMVSKIKDSKGAVLWELGGCSANGSYEVEYYDNGRVSKVQEYTEGGLLSSQSWYNETDTREIMYRSYEYDSRYGQLIFRGDIKGGYSRIQNLREGYSISRPLPSGSEGTWMEQFDYDEGRRLVSSTLLVDGYSQSRYTGYNSQGNIGSKSQVGRYSYESTSPHCLKEITAEPLIDESLSLQHQSIGDIGYDQWGRVTYVSVWNGINGYQWSMSYGADGSKLKSEVREKRKTEFSITPPIVVIGKNPPAIKEDKFVIGGGFVKPTPVPTYLVSTKYYADCYEEVIDKDGIITQRCYVYSPQGLICEKINSGHISELQYSGEDDVVYFCTDHQGSIVGSFFSKSVGPTIKRYDYDAWGMRREGHSYSGTFEGGFSYNSSNGDMLYMPPVTDYGYTGQEMLDYVGLIHYKARLYDPHIGRFISVDPKREEYPNYSPYTYCGNDPLNRIDPTGENWEVLSVKMADGTTQVRIRYVSEKDSYDENGKMRENVFEKLVFFSDNTSIGKGAGKIGNSTAYVYLYDGTILMYDAYTKPSDEEKFPTIPEGLYNADVGNHGKSGYKALHLTGMNRPDHSRIIDLGMPNKAYPNRDYAKLINVHKAGIYDNVTSRSGNAISEGCLLIRTSKYNEFISNFDKGDRIGVYVSRTLSAPNNVFDGMYIESASEVVIRPNKPDDIFE